MSEHDDILVHSTKPSIDDVERFLAHSGGQVRDYGENIDSLPLTHRWTPGMYIREIFMPAGYFVTTYIHKTTHPFVITKGRVSIYNELDRSSVEIVAPYTGITEAGTRRLLYIHEDTVWTTFHATHLMDVEEIERSLTDKPAAVAQLLEERKYKELCA